MLVKTSDLRLLDVVNIGDGRRLGHVYDLDLDVETGEILAIILPGEGGL
ncbi:MAG TPA: YlmC/YmxH family sporulation protein, partial [Limnochordia bacterium]|nr:YlmC/YmxH family sporulation protein [Limnochordia bacterium]